ncbi:FMN-linked oxidoreductase [Tricholoma matsutake]|nr:FMN-linked oxidoreductase [Tricholoma matsutake 945]
MSQLFNPIEVGNITLSHRVVLAPLTRYKATKSEHVPISSLVTEYYSQRSRTPGSLLITEATLIAAKAGGEASVPGIWSEEQIRVWKEITDAVHANGSYIFVQLWAKGRTANPAILKSEDPTFDFVAPSAIPWTPESVPREMTVAEIEEYIQLFAQAAKNAIFEAGFDGVEVHGANGFLVDQFLQDVSNQRTDNYGGSIEARSRFGVEVVDAIVEAVGEERTAIRLSPWNQMNAMGMTDPVPQFSHFISVLKERHPKMAYLHVVEPRVSGVIDPIEEAHESNEFLRDIWRPLPYISAGGYTTLKNAVQVADHKGGLIAFGRMYISNPDLPYRLKRKIPLTKYDRSTFYIPGDREDTAVGYIDYPPANYSDEE